MSPQGCLGTLWLGPAAGSRISQGSQGPVVKQSLLSWLGEGCEGWPGTGSCGMARASLPCLPWAGTLGAALASCSVLFVLRRWWLLIVPGDAALIKVTPISLLPRCLLPWSRSSCAGLHRRTLFHVEKGCLLFLCQALEHPVEQHSSRGGSGGSACCEETGLAVPGFGRGH